jgi:hypothetical protein
MASLPSYIVHPFIIFARQTISFGIAIDVVKDTYGS